MVEILILTGDRLKENLEGLARLRIEVFRAWPYLYVGSLAYEEKYLARYAETEGAVFVGAFEDDRLVGAATGEPLGAEYDAFKAPFEARGLDPGEIFYLAESVLQPPYRGRGLGHRFFDERENHARSLGFSAAAFCTVIRPDYHPLQPKDYSPLDPFWMKRGYTKLDGAIVTFPWTDIGESRETEKSMQVWLRQL